MQDQYALTTLVGMGELPKDLSTLRAVSDRLQRQLHVAPRKHRFWAHASNGVSPIVGHDSLRLTKVPSGASELKVNHYFTSHNTPRSMEAFHPLTVHKEIISHIKLRFCLIPTGSPKLRKTVCMWN